tara:strand:+ start:457 stop:726 length:270 start_codon:yes stop_codon:yes gene_type:complete
MEKQDKSFTMWQAEKEEYPSYLKKKLVEEVGEFVENPSLKELADVQEVVNAILKEMGYLQGDLRHERATKIEAHGGFEQRWILGEVEDD